MTLQIIDGPAFQPGESLSSGVDVSAGTIVRITTPGAWTPANLTFQISTDDASGYNDLYTAQGEEVTVVCKGGNSAILIAEPWTKAINFIKFRSGSRNYPVPQTEGRLFAIAIEVPDAAPAVESASRQREK
ncbi:hypothetical protein A1D31_22415 [Bradyrhizobium liaoningense]|nr:hypothetical protein A1D31_22415 [Bradyrhizobium liaoningense]